MAELTDHGTDAVHADVVCVRRSMEFLGPPKLLDGAGLEFCLISQVFSMERGTPIPQHRERGGGVE